MGVVAAIDDFRPHLSGIARCLNCKHEHVAVAPVGTLWMECPECGLLRAIFKNAIQRDGVHWNCGCGYDLFHITPDGIYCPNCGEWQNGF